jgi:hypothetical protein
MKDVLAFTVRPARKRSWVLAKEEAFCLLSDLDPEIILDGPLVEEGARAWFLVDQEYSSIYPSRFSVLGYSVAVNRLMKSSVEEAKRSPSNHTR